MSELAQPAPRDHPASTEGRAAIVHALEAAIDQMKNASFADIAIVEISAEHEDDG